MTASPPFIIGAGGANPVIYSDAGSVSVDSGADSDEDLRIVLDSALTSVSHSQLMAELVSEDIERVTKVLCRALGAV